MVRLLLNKFQFGICLVMLLAGLHAQAQTPQYYNNASATGSNAIPLGGAGYATNKAHFLYGPMVFNSGGSTGSPAYMGNITTVYFRITSHNAAVIYSDFTIALGQNVGTSTTFPSTTFASFTPNFYQATYSLTNTVSSGGWYSITLQTPFVYDPSQSLVFELKASASSGGSNTSNGMQQSALGQRLYAGYTAATGSSSTNAVDFGFDLVPTAPCSLPINPGTATISNPTPCLGQSTNLSLTGNTYGSGQSYQWESTTSLSSPSWTPEGSAQQVQFLTVTPAAVGNTYYRCAITCGSSTVYSDTLTATVPTLYPGGTYTINSALPTGSGNFQSFTDAVQAIKCGISGPVVFNVAAGSGPYNEQINLPATLGSNSTNTVIFNGNGRTLTSAGSGGNYATVNIDGTDNITFNNLNIEATGTNGFGVHLMNGADENKFISCNISANATATGTTSAGVSMSASTTSYSTGGVNGSNNLFDGCNVTGGYFGFAFYSVTGTSDSNNSIKNCTVKDFYVYGVYDVYQRSATISNNIIERPTRASVSTGYGIILTTGCVNMLVERNTVRNMYTLQPASTNTSYLLYCAVDGTAGRENKFINNLVYNIESNGTTYGLYLSGADYIQAYNNTIDLDYPAGTSGLVYGIYNTGTVGGIDIKNNNISIVKGGFDKKYGIYYTGAGAKSSNNNNIYVSAPSGTGFVGYNGTDITTLANWQVATGAGSPYDAQSTAEDPMFSSTRIPGNSLLDNTGTPLAAVLTDITNNPRNASTPDIGAHEYVVPACAGTAVAGTASSPDTALCMGGGGTITLSGYSTGQGISIQWEESTTGTGSWIPVASGGTTSSYNFSFAGPMYYRAAVTCAATSTPSYSNVVHIVQSPFYFCYCSPYTGTTLHTTITNYLTNVAITGTTLNNPTTAVGAGGYTPTDPANPSQTASVFISTPFTLNGTLGTTLATCEAWVDWDQSGTFDAGEYYSMTTTSTTASASITPPVGTLTGLTGLRIRLAYNSPNFYGASAACANPGTAARETEDYVINILPAPTCPPPSALAATNPTASSLDIGWTSNSTATLRQIEYKQNIGAFTLGTGTRVGPSGVTNPQTISGLAQGMPYAFYVREICGANDTSVWTGPVTAFTAFPSPPANDDCMTPVNISNGALYYGTNAGATQTLAPCDVSSPTATDVWYTFTTGSSAGVITDSVNTSFSGGDVVVQMFSGACGSLTPMVPTAGTTFNTTTGCVDGPAAGMEWSNYTVTANTTYFIRVYAFNTTTPGTFSIQITGAPLAIRLDKISASNAGASNRIDWNTLSEESTDKFELERSIDGKNFSRIHERKANGAASRYTYLDNSAAKGMNYYRLRMTAANGGATYSETVSAFVKSNGFEVEAFPNPVSHDLTVKVSGVQGADATVQVTDVTGKVIRTVKMNATFETIDMSGLAKGIYLIKYTDADHAQTIKVNKQ